MDEWITVRIKRPEDYEDVAPEIVVEDFIQTARHGGWDYEITKPIVMDSKESLRDPNRYNSVGDERALAMEHQIQSRNAKLEDALIQIANGYSPQENGHPQAFKLSQIARNALKSI